MALLSQLSQIKFHADKRARQWEKDSSEPRQEVVYLPTGVISPFVFVFGDMIATHNTTKFILRDHLDNAVYEQELVEVLYYETALATCSYYGETVSDSVEGYYYLELINKEVSYYSDMFGWTDNVDGLLKVTVQSSDIRVGGYTMPMESILNEFYLNAEYLGLVPKTDLNAIGQDGVNNIISGNKVNIREFNVDANESIYSYLSALPIIKCNGSVQFDWDYSTINASEIIVEELENHTNGIYQLKLSIIDESETVGVLNV